MVLECLAGVPGMRPAHSRVLFSHAQEAIAEEDDALDWDQVLGSVVGDEEVPFDSDEDEVSGEDEDEVSGEDEDEEEEAEGKEEEEAEGEEEEVVIVQERKRAREESAKPTDVRKAKARKVEPAKQGGRPKQQKRKRNDDDEVQKTPVKVPCPAPAPGVHSQQPVLLAHRAPAGGAHDDEQEEGRNALLRDPQRQEQEPQSAKEPQRPWRRQVALGRQEQVPRRRQEGPKVKQEPAGLVVSFIISFPFLFPRSRENANGRQRGKGSSNLHTRR